MWEGALGLSKGRQREPTATEQGGFRRGAEDYDSGRRGQGPQSLGEGQWWAKWVPRQSGRQGLGVTQHGVSQAGRVDTVR